MLQALAIKPLLAAALARLNAHAGTSAETWYAESAVPFSAALPYGTVTILDNQSLDTDRDAAPRLSEIIVQYHTEAVPGEAGDDDGPALDGIAAAATALESAPLAVSGFSVKSGSERVGSANVFSDLDGGLRRRRAVLRYQVTLYPTA